MQLDITEFRFLHGLRDESETLAGLLVSLNLASLGVGHTCCDTPLSQPITGRHTLTPIGTAVPEFLVVTQVISCTGWIRACIHGNLMAELGNEAPCISARDWDEQEQLGCRAINPHRVGFKMMLRLAGSLVPTPTA